MSATTTSPATARPSFFAPFRIRSFRFQYPSDLLTSWAFEMETLILNWFVFVATDSVIALTVFASLQYLGTLIAPMFGVVGDRIGHRRLLCGMRTVYAVLSSTLMVMAFSEVLNPVNVFVIAAVQGLVRPSDLGLRNALIGQSVPSGLIVGAMGISRTTQDSSRIMGTMIGAGLFAALGIGPAYIVVASFYTVGMLLTLGAPKVPPLYRPAAPGGAPNPSPWRDLADGLIYVWKTPHLQAAMYIAFLVNLLAFPITSGLMPYVARNIYHIDQRGLSYLMASFALGALCGSLTVSWLGRRCYLGRMILACGVAWHAMLIVFVHMPGPLSGSLTLIVAGFCQSLSMVPMAVMLVTTADEKFRGRVMGVRMLAIYSLPIGLIGAGRLIEWIGYYATALLYAGTGAVLIVAIGWHWRRHLWDLASRVNSR